MNVIWYEKAVCKIWIVATKCWIKEVDLWIWQGFLQNVRSVIFLTPLMKKKNTQTHTHTLWSQSNVNEFTISWFESLRWFKIVDLHEKSFSITTRWISNDTKPCCLSTKPSIKFFFQVVSNEIHWCDQIFPNGMNNNFPLMNSFLESFLLSTQFLFLWNQLSIHLLRSCNFLPAPRRDSSQNFVMTSRTSEIDVDDEGSGDWWRKNHTGVQITTTEYFVDPLNPSIKHSCSLSLSLFSQLFHSHPLFLTANIIGISVPSSVVEIFHFNWNDSLVIFFFCNHSLLLFFFFGCFGNDFHLMNFLSFSWLSSSISITWTSLLSFKNHYSIWMFISLSTLTHKKKHNWRTHTHTQQERFLKINNKWNKTDHSKRTTISRTRQQNHQVCTLFVVWISSLQCVAVCLFVCLFVLLHTHKNALTFLLWIFSTIIITCKLFDFVKQHGICFWFLLLLLLLFIFQCIAFLVVFVVVVINLNTQTKKRFKQHLDTTGTPGFKENDTEFAFSFFVCVWKQSTKKNDLRRKFWFNVKLMDINWEQTIEGTFFLETVEQLKNNPPTSPKKKSRNQKCWWVQWWELKYVTEKKWKKDKKQE